MTNKWFTDPETLKSSQYATQKNLSARIYIHEKFSTSPIDYTKWIFDRMLEDFPADADIVEFGCGNGIIWTSNLDRIPDGWKITLTDLSGGMLHDARQNLGDHADRFTFRVVDVQDVPFEDNQYDAVMANFMLYHVPDRQRALSEIRRILKPDGVLHSVTLGEKHMLDFTQLVRQVIPRYQFNADVLPFRVENAVEELTTTFDKVTSIPFDCDLRITEIEPCVAYLASTARLESVTHDELAKFRQLITNVIAEHGELYVQKHVVLFKSQGYAE